MSKLRTPTSIVAIRTFLWGEISVKITHTNVDFLFGYTLFYLGTHFFYLGAQFSFLVHTFLFGCPVLILGTHFCVVTSNHETLRNYVTYNLTRGQRTDFNGDLFFTPGFLGTQGWWQRCSFRDANYGYYSPE